MLAKLALRNIRRSFRDYAIYFITLVFGVAVFYAFCSVQSQEVLFDLEVSGSATIFATIGATLRLFSGIIAAVLGFLVVYANRFLIKRRKHEFGTYLMLGMKPSAVSYIVLCETILVGVVSLTVGLILGLALSQGLSFMTAFLFNISMTQYQFIFSPDAFLVTLLCFAFLFLVVAVFNLFTVSRYKLIDLLSATRQNERLGNRRAGVSFLLFVVSVIVLAVAYWLLIQNGFVMLDDPRFTWATVLMVAGTFLFFYSLAGFFITVIQRTRGIYFKKLNTFTLRQIASKINTASLSLGLVSVLLFFSITVFSCGMGLVETFTGNVDRGTQYDASLTSNAYMLTHDTDKKSSEGQAEAADQLAEAQASDFDMAAYLASKGVSWDAFAEKTMQVDVFEVPSVTYGSLCDVSDVGLSETRQESMVEYPLEIVGETQYNALRAATGDEIVNLGANGYIVNNLFDSGAGLSKKLAELENGVEIQGIRLKSVSASVFEHPLEVFAFSNDMAQLVVPDSVIASLGEKTPVRSYLNINYLGDRGQGDKALYSAIGAVCPPSAELEAAGFAYETNPWPVYSVFTSEEVIFSAGGMRILITYLALYIGFIFLITTAAVLAIQQLSEASDSIERYRLLSQIGCDTSMIASSLRSQVLIYFLAPLALATCHCICAIGVVGTSLFEVAGVSILDSSVMAAALVVLVYGSYLLVTYFASRGIVMSAISKRRV